VKEERRKTDLSEAAGTKGADVSKKTSSGGLRSFCRLPWTTKFQYIRSSR